LPERRFRLRLSGRPLFQAKENALERCGSFFAQRSDLEMQLGVRRQAVALPAQPL